MPACLGGGQSHGLDTRTQQRDSAANAVQGCCCERALGTRDYGHDRHHGVLQRLHPAVLHAGRSVSHGCDHASGQARRLAPVFGVLRFQMLKSIQNTWSTSTRCQALTILQSSVSIQMLT